MKITIRGYITHKEAEHYSDCADRYAINTNSNRFAIADGVSKSFYPDIWADILVNNFVSSDKENEFSIKKCQSEWLEKVTEKVQSLDAKWYTKNAFVKKEAGLATLVTLRFENGKWLADALGDSFLFFVSKESIGFNDWIKLSSKPAPVVFDSFPDYYSSRNKEHGSEKTIDEQDLGAGTFYLMTDALSEWVFSQKEKIIEEIKKWDSQEEFERSINELRSLNKLNNDDSAILIIEIEDDERTELTYEKNQIQLIDKLIEKEKEEFTQQNTIEKKESFVEEVKVENQKNGETEFASEKLEEKKGSDKPRDLFKYQRNKVIDELDKLNPDARKEELINICKNYDISVTD
ncbi:hypothetical protein EZS27_011133 [termite gut metagenome]|uniref:PPM-type phosphatase domain-containing protein n=1 Tax=termite gut metagenome TaxID=433724 RepID=A0A5J4S5I0_9ZZZZ